MQLLYYSNNFSLVVEIVLLPLYNSFCLHAFFYHCTPTMLKRIGTGILLLFISYFLSAIVGMFQVCSSANDENCIVHSAVFNVSENGLWWIMIPKATSSIGYLLLIVVLTVFVMAQTPQLAGQRIDRWNRHLFVYHLGHYWPLGNLY